MEILLGILYILLSLAIIGYVIFALWKKKKLPTIAQVRSHYIAKFIPETWAIPLVALVLLYLMPKAIEWIDPANHVVQSEIYQFLPMAFGATIMINGFAFLGVRINFKSAYKWYEQLFDAQDSPYLPWVFFASFLVYLLLPLTILAVLI